MTEEREVVIVTGSSGFIGRALVERLAERYTVVGFDRDLPPYPPVVAECVCVDLTSDASIKTALQRVRVAYGEQVASVIHLAAYFDLTGEQNPKYEEITVRGTERLLRELQALRVEQFVFASSMLVHAPSERGQRINEDSPLDPKELPYRESKIRARGSDSSAARQHPGRAHPAVRRLRRFGSLRIPRTPDCTDLRAQIDGPRVSG